MGVEVAVCRWIWVLNGWLQVGKWVGWWRWYRVEEAMWMRGEG